MVDFLRHGPHIHAGPVVFLIFFQHCTDLIRRKVHLDIEIRRDIPRAVILVFRIRAYLQFQIFDIIYPCKDDGMENRCIIPVQIISAKHRQEIKEHLVIGCIVHFIDHHDNRFGRRLAEFTQQVEHLAQCSLHCFPHKHNDRPHLIRVRPAVFQHFHKHPQECLCENMFIAVFHCTDSLKIKGDHKVIGFQVFFQGI